MIDHPSRRGFLLGGVAFTAWASIPRLAVAAAPRDPRFIAVILRGGLDGLAAVAPVGDPAYEEVRERFPVPTSGENAGFRLNDYFVLNSRLPTLADLYNKGEALFVHAVHTPYRQRSHFAAQDVLENGTPTDVHHRDGWLGRAIETMPVDSLIARQGGFAAASSTPLVMRGKANVVTYLPAGLPAASQDTRMRLLDLYEHTDPVLAEAFAEGLRLDGITGGEKGMKNALREDLAGMQMERRAGPAVNSAYAAGRAMAQDDGPRIGFLDMSGFDTHRAQKVINGRLGRTLAILDNTIETLRRSLGDEAWKDTVVAVITEFGRTVRMNGSYGTDHGSATVAMLLGGAVKGGRVVADWPGLEKSNLWDGRDLMPTMDLRGVLKGVMRDHLGLDQAALATHIFPETQGVRPVDGLIA